ncbi:MAG: hypothetical protein ABWX90_02540 [Candidatus Saccharimonadales bacterium]
MNAHQRRMKARRPLKFNWKKLAEQLKGKIVHTVIEAEMPTSPTGRGLKLHDYQLAALEQLKTLMPKRQIFDMPIMGVPVLVGAPSPREVLAAEAMARRAHDQLIIFPMPDVESEGKMTVKVLKSRGGKFPERFDIKLDFENMKFTDMENKDD